MPPSAPQTKWFHALVVMGTALTACGGQSEVEGPRDASSDGRDVPIHPNPSPDASPFRPPDAGAVRDAGDAASGDAGDGSGDGAVGVDCTQCPGGPAFPACCAYCGCIK
jgi:hypothetical protein